MYSPHKKLFNAYPKKFLNYQMATFLSKIAINACGGKIVVVRL